MRAIGILALLAATAGLPAAAHAEDDWTFSVTPYVWIAFPTGDVALASGRRVRSPEQAFCVRRATHSGAGPGGSHRLRARPALC